MTIELSLKEKLRELRHDRGNTQEELANHLGISAQAISKWERGDGLPDIIMLPGIAAYYDVTVDVLLGCDESKKSEKIAAFEAQCSKLLNRGKNAEKLALCREMAKEFPNDETVLYQLMHALYNADRTGNFAEITDIANRLLKSENNTYRFGAIQLLCFTYDANGQKERAIDYASMVPDNEDLLVHVLTGDLLVEHCQWYFWRICDNMQQKLAYLLETPEAGYTAAQRHKMRKTLYDFYHAVFSDGDFGFWHDRLGRLCFLLALSSAECGENDRALDELAEMAAHFAESERFTAIDHTSPLVNTIHYEDAMLGRSCERSICLFYIEDMKNPCLDGIRDCPRFQAVETRLREIAAQHE